MRLKPVLVTIALLGYLKYSVAHERADYGEACDGVSVMCNRRANLNCSPSGACNCTIPGSMVYQVQGSTGLCAVKAGEQCKFQRGLDENSDPVYTIYPCIETSDCDQDGYCSCFEGFYESSDGTCHPGRTYGQSCDDERKCLSGSAFHCINGTCACDLDSSIYDPSQEACVGLVGETCVEGRCISGACVKGRCTCPSSQFMLNSTFCDAKRGVGETCESQDWCGREELTGTGLTCEGKEGINQCGCPSKTSVYAKVTRNFGHSVDDHSEKSLCAPKPHQPCFEGFCSPSAKCNVIRVIQSQHPPYYSVEANYWWGYSYRYWGTTFCQCVSPTQVSPSTGECVSPYDHTCDDSLGCMESLTCRDGRCGCTDTQHYDTSTKQCLAKVGEYCHQDSDCAENSNCNTAEWGSNWCTCNAGFVRSVQGLCGAEVGGSCKSNGDCDQVNNKLICDPSGRCTCPSGQHLSPTTGKCSLPHLARCDNSVPCGDTFVCKQGRCQCPLTLQVFDPIEESCVSKVDGPCSSNSECVNRAHCQFAQDNVTASFGSCICNPEAVETRDGLCTLTEGAGCSSDADCDPEAGLQCMDQTCQCPTHATYSRELRTCKGLIGAPCASDPHLGGEHQSKSVVGSCTENAICTKPRTTSLTSKCVCPEKYVMTSTYDCVRSDDKVSPAVTQNAVGNHPDSTSMENWWPALAVPGENRPDGWEWNSSN